MRKIPFIAGAALCLSFLVSSAQALEPDAIFEKVSPSVWFVRALDGDEKPLALGSAVVIAPGKLVTNCHVLAKARAIQVRKDNVSYAATLEFPDPERDLCQISVRNFSAPALEISATKHLKIGQRVYTVGNPRGLELSMSEGIISSLRDIKENAPLIQTTAPISPGSSGGGLFDSDGRLIGITSFSRRDAQNLNFAHPADWILELPERGAAILARRSTPGAASAATSATASNAAPTGAFPRTLTGDEFADHIRRLSRVVPRNSQINWFRFRSDGFFEVMSPTSMLPSGLLISGNYRLNTSNSTVCIALTSRRATNDSYPEGLNLSGCFGIVQLGEKNFAFKSTAGEISIQYDHPG